MVTGGKVRVINGMGPKTEAEFLKAVNSKTDLIVLDSNAAKALALAAKGVGPRTAAKIISKLSLGEMEFYKAIVEAEKTYLRTRMFWN